MTLQTRLTWRCVLLRGLILNFLLRSPEAGAAECVQSAQYTLVGQELALHPSAVDATVSALSRSRCAQLCLSSQTCSAFSHKAGTSCLLGSGATFLSDSTAVSYTEVGATPDVEVGCSWYTRNWVSWNQAPRGLWPSVSAIWFKVPENLYNMFVSSTWSGKS